MYWNHLLLVQLGWKHDAGAIWYLVASGHMENAWTYVEGGCIYYHTFIFDHTCVWVMRQRHLLYCCCTLPILQMLGKDDRMDCIVWNVFETFHRKERMNFFISFLFLPSPFCLQELSRAVEWYLNNPSAFNYTMLDNLLTYIGQSLSYVCIWLYMFVLTIWQSDSNDWRHYATERPKGSKSSKSVEKISGVFELRLGGCHVHHKGIWCYQSQCCLLGEKSVTWMKRRWKILEDDERTWTVHTLRPCDSMFGPGFFSYSFVHSEDYFSLLVLVFPEGFWPLPRAARRICVLLRRVKQQSCSVNICELFDFSLKISSFQMFRDILSTWTRLGLLLTLLGGWSLQRVKWQKDAKRIIKKKAWKEINLEKP